MAYTEVIDASTYATLQAAVTDIGSDTRTLEIHEALDVTANVTVPDNITLRFTGDGTLNISSSVVATINGPLEAAPKGIFTGSGTVSGIIKAEQILPEWWGAVGDGSTDDQAAFTAALAAVDEIYPGPRTYYLGSTLTISGNNKTIDGPGEFKGNSGLSSGSAVFELTGTGITLRNITIDQNNISAGRSININGGAQIIVENVTSKSVQQAFIRMAGQVKDVTVTGCVHRSRGYGVLVSSPSSGSERLRIAHNVFEFTESTGLGDGVEISAATNGLTDYQIIGNEIRGYIGNSSGAGIGIGVVGGKRGIIKNNQIFDVESDGILLKKKSDDVIIQGNMIDGSGKTGGTTHGAGIRVLDSDRVQIDNNTITDVLDAHGILVSGDITSPAQYLTGIRITNNSINGVDNTGIVYAGLQGYLVSGNEVRNADRDNDGTDLWGGIDARRITPAVTTVDSLDGLITHNQVADGSGVPDKAIKFDSNSGASTTCAFNNATGSTNKISDASGNVEMRANRIGSNAMSGSFTVTASSTTTVVSNNNVLDAAHVRVWPKNAAAAAMAGDATGVVVSSATAATSFTVSHSDPGASPTEQFYYEIV